MDHRKSALALAAVTAIAAPAAALAKPGNGNASGHGQGHGNPHATETTSTPTGAGHGPAKGVAYVFKGTYAGAGVVSVTKGNSRVRKADLAGTDVEFDLSAAKLSVADTNGDSAVTVDDVVVGDRVVVKAKLPKGDPGVAPYAARHLVDQTNPAPEA